MTNPGWVNEEYPTADFPNSLNLLRKNRRQSNLSCRLLPESLGRGRQPEKMNEKRPRMRNARRQKVTLHRRVRRQNLSILFRRVSGKVSQGQDLQIATRLLRSHCPRRRTGRYPNISKKGGSGLRRRRPPTCGGCRELPDSTTGEQLARPDPLRLLAPLCCDRL